MSLNNQNRLQEAFSELPTRLKFRSLIESHIKTKRSDPLILNTIEKADYPAIIEFWKKYQQLPFLYYEKLFLSQRQIVYETRECWKDQTTMTLSALKLALSYIDILENLNTSQLKYKDLSEHCKERKQQLSGLIIQIKELLEDIDGLMRRRPEFQIAFDEIVEKIDEIENALGFTYPYKDAFL